MLKIFEILFIVTELDTTFIYTKLLDCILKDMSTKLFQSDSFTNSALLVFKETIVFSPYLE